jgi:hypothetical protein
LRRACIDQILTCLAHPRIKVKHIKNKIHLQYLCIICLWFKIWPTPAKNHCYAWLSSYFKFFISTLLADIVPTCSRSAPFLLVSFCKNKQIRNKTLKTSHETTRRFNSQPFGKRLYLKQKRSFENFNIDIKRNNAFEVMLQFKVLLVRTATAHGEYVHDFFSHFPLYLQYELTPLPDLLTN